MWNELMHAAGGAVAMMADNGLDGWTIVAADMESVTFAHGDVSIRWDDGFVACLTWSVTDRGRLAAQKGTLAEAVAAARADGVKL